MPTVPHKLRPYTEDDFVDLDPVDRSEGTWTRLELLEMDARFCAAMRRAHPELGRQGVDDAHYRDPE